MASTSNRGNKRPHQRPILTRFAFVIPVRCHPRGIGTVRDDVVVPCEPEDAQAFSIASVNPRTWEVTIVDKVEGFITPGGWRSAFHTAQNKAEMLDLDIARDNGVPR